MSTGTPEGTPQGPPNGDNSPEANNGHPAWADLLNELPEDLQPLLKPKLEEWDKGFNQRLQGVHEQYDPYKPLVENQIPIERVEQALYLAYQLEQNPQQIIDQAIKAFDLDYVPGSNVNDPDDDDEYDDEDLDYGDLENHPAFKEMMQKVNKAQEILDGQAQTKQQEEAQQQTQSFLEQLHRDEGDFDDLYVMALMSQGVDGKKAVEQYKTTIASGVQAAMNLNNPNPSNTPPIVMGGDGATGTGIPTEPVKFGDLSKNDLNSVVMQFLEQNKSE